MLGGVIGDRKMTEESRILQNVKKAQKALDAYKRPLDEFHQHEALHTAHVLINTWADHVLDSRFVEENPEIQAKAEAALVAMADVYQAIGVIEMDDP